MKTLLISSLLILSDDDVGSPPSFDGDADADTDADADKDNDEDGFTNAEEAEAGTNPDYGYSHPYTGNYNVGFCDTPPAATGATGVGQFIDPDTGEVASEWPSLGEGDVPNNLTFMDQHGENVDLYSFCGKHVMILVSAGWCGPCRSLAQSVQDIQNEYRDEGLQIIEMITGDNNNAVPDQAFLQDWASEYGFEDIPVLSIPAPTDYEFPQFLFDADGYIPSVYHLNGALEVVSPDQSVHDPGSWL
jgi:thiol-disulfide isomerase/thioredoxin